MTNVNEAMRNVDRDTAASTSGFTAAKPVTGPLLAVKEAEEQKLTQAVTNSVASVDPMMRESYERMVSDGKNVQSRQNEVESELAEAMEEFSRLSKKIASLSQRRAKLQQQSVALSMARIQMKSAFDLNVTDG